MAYTATVIPVMIASPGDVLNERNIARDLINDWNSIHSLASKAILTPVGWDSHASPDLGGRPQKLINERVLKDCDLLVGIFWTRLGTPTGEAESGTVEEIQTHLAAGKPVMVYFSDAPVAPASLNPTQYAAVQSFRGWCEKEGLISTFENLPDFRTKFARDLQIQMNTHPYLRKLREEAGKNPWGGLIANLQNSALSPSLSGSQLTDDARELLLEATEGEDGIILKVESMGGGHVQVNDKVLGEGDSRSFAKWMRAIDQLQRFGLIEERGYKREVFEVTADGYDFADKLRI